MAKGTTLLAITIASLVIAWMFVLLRCFVRIKIVRSFGLDDWLMVMSVIGFSAFSGIIIAGFYLGIGGHPGDFSLHVIEESLKYQLLSQFLYLIDVTIIKLSIGFLFLRICSVGSGYRLAVYISMICGTIWMIITFFVSLFQCVPIRYNWEQVNPTAKGKCMSGTIILRYWYATLAIVIFFDFFFALLPIPLIWNIQLSLRKKLSIIFILGLGLFASTATIARLKSFTLIFNNEGKNDNQFNLLYTYFDTLIWSVVECGIGITAASMATLRPLFTKNISGFTSDGGKHNYTQQPKISGYQQSEDLSSVHQQSNIRSAVMSSNRDIETGKDSQELIVKGGNMIQTTMEVDVVPSHVTGLPSPNL